MLELLPALTTEALKVVGSFKNGRPQNGPVAYVRHDCVCEFLSFTDDENMKTIKKIYLSLWSILHG